MKSTYMKMRLKLLLCCLLHIANSEIPVGEADPPDRQFVAQDQRGPRHDTCLTGYMTNVQSWVDEFGHLTSNIDIHNTIDVSLVHNVVPAVHQQIQGFRYSDDRSVRFLSLAKCKLSRVPSVFQLKDSNGRAIADTVEYITLYGNQFMDVSSPGEQYGVHFNATGAREVDSGFSSNRHIISAWSAGFNQIQFTHLRQLDLRRCSIQTLSDHLFERMPRLEALYLGENSITYVSARAFHGLRNLLHLDLSRNLEGNDNEVIVFESSGVFFTLRKLISIDFSYTKLLYRDIQIFKSLRRSFQRLSLCYTGLPRLAEKIFNNTSLRYLDVSGNSGILSGYNILGGTENTLQVLYADSVALKIFEIFHNFTELEILKLSNNEISLITIKTAKSLINLKILDLRKNRMTTWFNPLFTSIPRLQFLSLQENNINLISEDMMYDFKNISYIALSGNFIVCNCHTRELFEIALRNEKYVVNSKIIPKYPTGSRFSYHNGFINFNQLIRDRKNVTRVCNDNDTCIDEAAELEADGNFLLLDFDATLYQCLLVAEGKSIEFSDMHTCQQARKENEFENVINDGWNKLLVLWIIPTVLFPMLILGYVFRRRLRYFYVTMRNSAMLSMINKDETIDEDTIFNYDVFVSYCNEDRNWILDYLLPHVEKDCNICLCLHERDFQVGLSILENIVSCMDRSRSIMLIISKRFLLSQWCQFEMHLAQHRLLETRREDLILVLLEDIPRRLRPTTLHYLMLTKTYIVWPKEESDQAQFWRRLKKSLVTYRLKQPENISLA